MPTKLATEVTVIVIHKLILNRYTSDGFFVRKDVKEYTDVDVRNKDYFLLGGRTTDGTHDYVVTSLDDTAVVVKNTTQPIP